MSQFVKPTLAALALAAGVAVVPTTSQAEPKAKADAVEAKKAGATDDFEENRKAHIKKSRENNEKKGAE